jgi:DNA-binding MltR family transcriptional regulator
MKELDPILEKHLPRVLRFRKTLSQETDRGCAMIAAAFLDSELATLLRHSLVQDERAQAEFLTGKNGPLGSFSSRIDAAYLLGKMSLAVHRELHLIRRIRNEFGHDPEPITFNHAPIASRCRELRYSPHKGSASPRGHFTSSACGILAAIHVADMSSQPPVVPKDLLPTDKMKKEVFELTKAVFKALKPRPKKRK